MSVVVEGPISVVVEGPMSVVVEGPISVVVEGPMSVIVEGSLARPKLPRLSLVRLNIARNSGSSSSSPTAS